ncbi:NAD(P)-binding domain-containing protein [Burkholderia cenocepacia]
MGLSNIGSSLAAQALEKGCRVVGYDKRAAPQKIVEVGMVSVQGVGGFRQALSRPRTVFRYVPAGPVAGAVARCSDLGLPS